MMQPDSIDVAESSAEHVPSYHSTESPTSCERCKKRKSRCDRALPACRRCEQGRTSCVYQTRRRPGFAAGHRQGLESRISDLETENQFLRAELMSNNGPGRNRQSSTVPPEPSSSVAQGQEPTPAYTHPTGSTHAHAPSRFLPDGESITDQVFKSTYARTSTIVERRPPLDLVISSISVFLRHIHPWFPFLDVQRVLSELVTTREPSLLLNAIFGASLPYLYDPRLDQTTSDSFWKYTKRKIFVEATEEPSYASLEACTILTLDLSGMTNGPQVWSRLAVVTKLAAQLRTLGGRVLRPSVQTNDLESTGSSKPGSKQHARLFWAIYALDSFISITTNQPPLLTDFYLCSFLPTRESTWKDSEDTSNFRQGSAPRLPSATSLFIYQLEILDISRQIHAAYLEYLAAQDHDDDSQSQILQPLLQNSDKPLEWLGGLPSCLNVSPTTHPLIVMVHTYSHALTLFAKGFVEFSARSLGSPLASLQISTKLAEDGARSVAAIVQLCNQAVGSIGDQLGWPFAWSIWVAARYLLVAAARRSTPLNEDFYVLVKALNRMGNYWQVSKKYWRLLCRAEESLRQGGDAPSSRLLAALIDLRISISDLEDQFRIDPVLCHSKSQGESTAQSSAVSLVEDTTMAVGDQSLYTAPDDTGFGHDQYFSDTWFTSPLFASSAYQIEPGPVGDVQTAPWGL